MNTWNPITGEELLWNREPKSSRDECDVAIVEILYCWTCAEASFSNHPFIFWQHFDKPVAT